MSISHLIEQAEQSSAAPSEPRPRREVTWTEARIFVVSTAAVTAGLTVTELPGGEDLRPFAGCLMLGIKRSDHRDFPAYRMTLGTVLTDGRFVPGVSPRADLEQLRLGSIVWDGAFEAMQLLIEAAKAWVQLEQSVALDRYLVRRGGAPERTLKGAAGAVRHTGKTERNRARGKAQPKHD